jgi:hypothetical protein
MNESRYSTLDRLIRVKNTDGPLTLCIRKIRPGPIRIHLPARAQRLDLSRHAPLLAKEDAPSIVPASEGTWKPPGIVKVK